MFVYLHHSEGDHFLIKYFPYFESKRQSFRFFLVKIVVKAGSKTDVVILQLDYRNSGFTKRREAKIRCFRSASKRRNAKKLLDCN